jgi:hypothetical protein
MKELKSPRATEPASTRSPAARRLRLELPAALLSVSMPVTFKRLFPVSPAPFPRFTGF